MKSMYGRLLHICARCANALHTKCAMSSFRICGILQDTSSVQASRFASKYHHFTYQSTWLASGVMHSSSQVIASHYLGTCNTHVPVGLRIPVCTLCNVSDVTYIFQYHTNRTTVRNSKIVFHTPFVRQKSLSCNTQNLLLITRHLTEHVFQPHARSARHYSSSAPPGRGGASFPRLHPVPDCDIPKEEPTNSNHYSNDILHKLRDLENATRFHGYSTIRIGLLLVGLAALTVYVFRDHLRDHVADEVSAVASESLSSEPVRRRAQELATELANYVITHPETQDTTINYFKEILQNPETQSIVSSFLTHLLQDPETQKYLTASIKQIFLAALDDVNFQNELAMAASRILQTEAVTKASYRLVASILSDPSLQRMGKVWLADVLASDTVKNQAFESVKSVALNLVEDPALQKQATEAMWTVTTNTFLPGWFESRPKQP